MSNKSVAVLFAVLLFLAYIYYRRVEGFKMLPGDRAGVSSDPGSPGDSVTFRTPIGQDVQLTGESVEPIRRFIAPYYLNSEKYQCDIYPRANGSIYKLNGDLLTGFPFYDRAY